VDGETAGRLETSKDALTREPEKNCEGHENPRSVAGSKTPGQAAITARDASPERVPIRKPATNDPRGRRLQKAKMKASETRGAKNRRDETADGVGAKAGETSQRDGLKAGRFQTVRRSRQTLKGKSATSREAPCRSARATRRTVIGQAGDEGGSHVLP